MTIGILHCGFGKAGSSSLQSELASISTNPDNAVAFLNPSVRALRFPDDNPVQVDEFVRRCRPHAAAAAQAGANLVISSESLMARPHTAKALCGLLAEHADHVTVCAIVRRPASSVLSAFKQWGFRLPAVLGRLQEFSVRAYGAERRLLMAHETFIHFCADTVAREGVDALGLPSVLLQQYCDPGPTLTKLAATLADIDAVSALWLSLDDVPPGTPLASHLLATVGIAPPRYVESRRANPSFDERVVDAFSCVPTNGDFVSRSPLGPSARNDVFRHLTEYVAARPARFASVDKGAVELRSITALDPFLSARVLATTDRSAFMGETTKLLPRAAPGRDDIDPDRLRIEILRSVEARAETDFHANRISGSCELLLEAVGQLATQKTSA